MKQQDKRACGKQSAFSACKRTGRANAGFVHNLAEAVLALPAAFTGGYPQNVWTTRGSDCAITQKS